MEQHRSTAKWLLSFIVVVIVVGGVLYVIWSRGSPARATVDISDDDTPLNQTVNISPLVTGVGEPTSNGGYRITRTGLTDKALTVNFSVSGSASRGPDYLLRAGGEMISGTTVTIPAGQASVDITLEVANDSDWESTETATIALESGDYTIGSGQRWPIESLRTIRKREALIAVEEEKDDEAILMLTKLKKVGEQDPDIYAGLTRVYLVKRFYDMAVEEATEGLRFFPQQPALLLLRAKARLWKDDILGAIQDCRTAVRNNPQDSETCQVLGIACCAHGELEEAGKWFDSAKRLNSTRSQAIADTLAQWANEASSRDKRNEVEWAINKANQIFPQGQYRIRGTLPPESIPPTPNQQSVVDFNNNYNRGVKHLDDGLPDLAVTELEKCVKLKPDRFEAWVKLAHAYSDIHEPHHVLFACDKAIAIKGLTADVHFLMGRAYGEQGRYDLAVRHLTEAERLDPALAPDVTKALRLVQQRQADAYLKADKCDDAIALLQQTEKVDSGAKAALADAFEKRAGIRRTAGDFDGSNEDLKEAERIDPTPARKRRIALTVGRAHCERGDALLRDGDNRGAIAEYELAKTSAPSLTGRANAALIKLFQRRATELRRAGFIAEAQRDTERANALIRQDLQEPRQKP